MMNNLVVKGKASVCNWDLRARFITKEQVKEAIILLLEEEVDFNFSVSMELGDSYTPNVYILDIDDMPWANNLKTVAKILKKVDYKYE